MWLEQLARGVRTRRRRIRFLSRGRTGFPTAAGRGVDDRLRGREPAEIARAFHRGLAAGLVPRGRGRCAARTSDAVVLSGGVFQNELLFEDCVELLDGGPASGPITRCRRTTAASALGRRRWPRWGAPAMHELSIALSIVDLACEEAETRGVRVPWRCI